MCKSLLVIWCIINYFYDINSAIITGSLPASTTTATTSPRQEQDRKNNDEGRRLGLGLVPGMSSSMSLSFLFAKAQEEDEQLLENKARFILNASRKRRQLFEKSILDHYGGSSDDHGGGRSTGRDGEVRDVPNEAIKPCSHFFVEKEKMWYEVCPEKHIRRFQASEATIVTDSSSETPPSDQELYIMHSKQYKIRNVELLGTYESDYPPNETDDAEYIQFYSNGSNCPDGRASGYSTKLGFVDCCKDEYFSDLDDDYYSDDVKNEEGHESSSSIGSDGNDEHEDNHSEARIKMELISIINPDNCEVGMKVCYNCGPQYLVPPWSSSTTNSRAIPSPSHPQQRQGRGRSVVDYYLHQTDLQKRVNEPINKTAAADQPTNLQVLRESLLGSFPPMPRNRISDNINTVKSMFQHAYDSYMYNAYPYSELKPLSCKAGLFDLVRLPALTLIDSLDMLLILRNHTEFARSVERLRNLDLHMRKLQKSSSLKILLNNPVERGGLFTVDQNVSVFETNIRVLGGLLSAHQMAEVWMDNQVLVDDVFHDDNRAVIGVDIGKGNGNRVVNGDVNGKDDAHENKRESSGDRHDNTMSMCIGEDGKTRICSQSEVIDPLESQSSGHDSAASDATKASNATEYWNYDGFLLELAHDIGRRLLPAFKTDTGIPYGTVNLLYGIPPSETTIASLAGGGTLSLEMELLSRLTGDPTFGKAAKLATRALFLRRSPLDLLGKHIDIKTGSWTEIMAGIGSNSDSVYEYLIKHYTLFQEDEDFFTMFDVIHNGINQNGKLGDWYPDVPMANGLSQTVSVLESLAAFYPGMQILLGEFNPAARSTNAFTMAREAVKFLPERFDFSNFEAASNHNTYPLRPELYESNYFLHMAAKNLGLGNSTSGWLWSADFFLHALEETARTECGYAVVKGVSTKAKSLRLGDEMPSFFLSETLKYLFLTFDETNPIDTDKERNWIFTTEAHPIHSAPTTTKEAKHENKSFKSRSQEDDWYDTAKSDLLESLDVLIKANNTEQGAVRIPIQKKSPGKSWNNVHNELWTSSTGKFPYIKEVQKFAGMQPRKGRNFNIEAYASWQKGSIGRIVELPLNVIGESAEGEPILNFATLGHDKDGRGTTISQSCPNYHQSNSLWIQALVGEELDYTQFFESTLSNIKEPPTTKPSLSSPLAASALFGTGFLSSEENQCKKSKKKKQNESVAPNGPMGGSQRIDMGGNLGAFDININSAGVGYHVTHLRTGESIEVTIVQSDQEQSTAANEDVFIAVDSFLVTGSSSKVKVGLLNQIKSVFSHSGADFRKKRHVMIADMSGHAFECKVELKLKINDDYQRIAVFPCLPAAYGKTSMDTLNTVNEDHLNFEAVLHKPDASDIYGCHQDWDDICDTDALEQRSKNIRSLEKQLNIYVEYSEELTKEDRDEIESDDLDIDEITKMLLDLKNTQDNCIENNSPPRVQLVHRGKCNFRGKGINQSGRFNAKALIVINSERRKLFIMAGMLTKSQEMSNVEEPISVLVTKDDGEEIMSILDRYGDEDAPVIASVRVIRRNSAANNNETKEDQDKNIKEKTIWPMIMTSPGNIQVHSSQGWGVGAVKEKDIWQVMLLENRYKDK